MQCIKAANKEYHRESKHAEWYRENSWNCKVEEWLRVYTTGKRLKHREYDGMLMLSTVTN